MEKLKHSGGEWRLAIDGHDVDVIGERMICKLSDWKTGIYGAESRYAEIDAALFAEKMANGKLIKNAPTMYAGLRALRQIYAGTVKEDIPPALRKLIRELNLIVDEMEALPNE